MYRSTYYNMLYIVTELHVSQQMALTELMVNCVIWKDNLVALTTRGHI
jgi:hypothetical protein